VTDGWNARSAPPPAGSTLPANGNPNLPVHEWGAFRDQIIGTAILLLVILAVTDLLNTPPGANLGPFVIGLLVVGIGMAWGTLAGYAINPARDFGPRLFTAVAGWHGEVFTAGGGWWWVPIVAPCIGGLVGTYAYDLLVGNHLPKVAVKLEAEV